MADFAFTRQDETSIISESTRIVPLTCHGHSRPITHVSFSSLLPGNHYYLISACKDNNPMLRDGSTGDWIGTFIGHKGAVWSARLSDDASLAATGSADFSAKVWDTMTGEALFTLQHNHIVRAVAFPPGGRPHTLATGGMEKRLRIFDIADLAATSSSSSSSSPVTNGSGPAPPSSSSTPSLPRSTELGPDTHQAAIKSIIWTRDPNTLLTAADDKTVRWWDVRARASVASFEIDGPPGSCELSAANAGSGGGGGGVPGHADGIVSVAAGKNLYFFDGARPAALVKHVRTDREVASVALNSAAGKFVTGSPNDTWVHVWDLESGRELETGRGHHGPVWTTCFSPDGKLYATGSEDGTVKLWKFTEGPYALWR